MVLVPRRADPWRDALWAYARPWWAEHGPVVEGWHTADEGPFNRSAAMNRAAADAGPWRVAVLIDADVVPAHHDQVDQAVGWVRHTGEPVLAYDRRVHLNRATTRSVLAGRALDADTGRGARVLESSCSSAVVVRRDLWDRVGGMDERFVGWGWEDVAFRYALETMAGAPLRRVLGYLWHLWHPRGATARGSHPQTRANRYRHDLYLEALGDRARMAEVLAR